MSLVTSLVLSRLDYGSATLAGIPKYQFDRLQPSVTLYQSDLVYVDHMHNGVGHRIKIRVFLQ